MFKPMLAPREGPKTILTFFDDLPYPLLVSPKLDGIRCIIKDNECKSRTFKPLPSYQAHSLFGGINHLDGELIIGSPTDGDVYNRTQSHVMSDNKPGDLHYYVFDYCHPDWLDRPFIERFNKAAELIEGKENYHIVPHSIVYHKDWLLKEEEAALIAGYEGLIARNPQGRYKCGRGTYREGLIFKIKREVDDEGTIVDFVERMVNNNTLEEDELGYAKRSSAKDGKIPAGTLGKFKVDYQGTTISVAPGSFNHEELQWIWDNRDLVRGKLLKFRYFPHGIKDLPRHPRAIGFRDLIDL